MRPSPGQRQPWSWYDQQFLCQGGPHKVQLYSAPTLLHLGFCNNIWVIIREKYCERPHFTSTKMFVHSDWLTRANNNRLTASQRFSKNFLMKHHKSFLTFKTPVNNQREMRVIHFLQFLFDEHSYQQKVLYSSLSSENHKFI